MSVLSNIQEDLQSSLFDTEGGIGEEVVYRFRDGTTKNIIAVADIGNTRLPDAERKNRTYLDALFTIKEGDIEKPKSGDKVIYHGKEYDFYSIHNRTMGMVTLRCVQGRSAVTYA